MRARLRVLVGALALAGGAGFDWPGKVAVIARGLDDADVPRRREVIEKLAAMDPERTRGALLKALADPERDVRLAAGQLLGRHHAKEAVEPIAAWLQASDPAERAVAVGVLGAIGDRAAIPPLTRALADAEPDVRRGAVRALEEIGGADVVPPIVGRLDDEAAPVRRAAAEALREVGDERAVVPLLGRLADASREVRVAAIQALGRRGDPKTARTLLRLLDDPLEDVRVAAIEALGLLRAREAEAPLIGALAREAEGKAAVLALGRLGGPRAAAEIVKTLGRASMRSAAHEALLLLGADAVPALLDVLGGRAEGDPAAAISALGAVGDRRATTALIEELGRGRVPPARVLDALRMIGDPTSLPALLAQLRAPDARVRLAVLDALEPIVDARAADSLVDLLEDRDPAVRARACELAGIAGARPAVPALVRALADRDEGVRVAAAVALGRARDPRGTAPLLERLSGDGPLPHRAADALAEIGDPGALPPLVALASATSPTRIEALRALVGVVRGRQLGAASALLEAAARGDEPLAAAHAIDALGAASDPRATRLLIALAREAGPRRLDALRALARAPEGKAVLEAAFVDPDADVRAAAAWATAIGSGPPPAGLIQLALGNDAPAATDATAALARRGLLTRADGLALTRHRVPGVRANAALGLVASTAGPTGAAVRAHLGEMLERDPSVLVRQAAARALSRAGGEAKRLAAALAREPEPSVRDLLAAALPTAGAARPTRPSPTWTRITWLERDGSPLRLPAAFQLLDGAGYVIVGQVPVHAETTIEQLPEGPFTFEILDENGEPTPTDLER